MLPEDFQIRIASESEVATPVSWNCSKPETCWLLCYHDRQSVKLIRNLEAIGARDFESFMDYVLLTGCTGFIGRYLLHDLLVANVPVVALLRPRGNENARTRLERIVQSWEAQLGRRLPRPICFSSDVHQPSHGLLDSLRSQLRGQRGAVLHNAGNVAFHRTSDNEPWRTNVEGTRYLVELAQELGIEEFHHVSTAYVCGDRRDTIYEEQLDCGQQFESDYEHSKFAAEKMIRQAGFRKLNVFRPGSVTGDSRNGYTLTYHGIYLFARFTHWARRRCGGKPGQRWHFPLRLLQTGMERHHLVPVDVVSNAIVAIVGQRLLPGNTYHLTPVKPTTNADVEAAIANFFNYYGVSFEGQHLSSPAPFNEIEQAFNKATAGAEHRYCHSDPEFKCQNTLRAYPEWSGVEISEEYLLRIFDFAVRNHFGYAHSKLKLVN
jgi:nucleoside-diphosphate-sugar epimerase